MGKGVEGIAGRWKQDKLRAVGIKRATALIEAARLSVGVREGIIAAKNELINLLENYELQMRQYERTMSMVEQLVKQIPGLEEMVKIKGVGLITAAGFIAEVGDISRFEHPRQIQKLAGLNLRKTVQGSTRAKVVLEARTSTLKITAVPSSDATCS